MTASYLIGVDGGGTGTRARLCGADGRPLGQGQAGPSSLSHGVAGAWRQDRVRRRRGLRPGGPGPARRACSLGAGLAGVNDPAQAAEFKATDPGFAALALDTDSFTALVGAHDGEPGLVLIAGTGSIGEAWFADGSRRIVGGWGFPFGDEGSGGWLGLEAVRLAQHAIDGRAAPGPLADAVCRATGRTLEAMFAWCAQANQTRFATLAPLVFEHEATDLRAAALLERAVQALAELAQALDPAGALPIACSGSVARRLQARLPATLRARCREPAGDAADGALHLLRRQLAGGGPA
ncbi:MAG: BadF/BadG/BcrA/BcrD ATPase family protein [Burkholderiaceae bacterium]